MMEEKELQPGGASLEDAAQYWRAQGEWLQQQLSVQRAITEKLAGELRDALTAVEVLARLVWNRS